MTPETKQKCNETFSRQFSEYLAGVRNSETLTKAAKDNRDLLHKMFTAGFQAGIDEAIAKYFKPRRKQP